jgi:hypothetical protein
MTLGEQVVSLLILAVPVASVSWTVTHEEIFREPREYCQRRSETCRRLLERKFFYLFTCEFCFSHYISALFIWISGYKLLFDGWRGYMIAWFALVWVANQYMSIFGRLRLDIKRERVEIESVQEEVKAIKEETKPKSAA